MVTGKYHNKTFNSFKYKYHICMLIPSQHILSHNGNRQYARPTDSKRPHVSSRPLHLRDSSTHILTYTLQIFPFASDQLCVCINTNV